VEVIDVPGHHGSIMRDPRAKTLARKLMESLNAARPEEQGENGSGKSFRRNTVDTSLLTAK
jgi:hypothetical protein